VGASHAADSAQQEETAAKLGAPPNTRSATACAPQQRVAGIYRPTSAASTHQIQG
jgi:hypothetical protein